MANQSGRMYGLTILSPIKEDLKACPSDETALRIYLSSMPNGVDSPFARVNSTHLCRLVVMDDIVYVGAPVKEEHLKSAYLMFTTNFDGELDDYLKLMLRKMGREVNDIWSHCVGFPGTTNVDAFLAYMRKCQLTTTFFFADVNDRTLTQTLRALQVQREVARFIENNQGRTDGELQDAFRGFLARLEQLPPDKPGSAPPCGPGEPMVSADIPKASVPGSEAKPR